jgi:putative DNA primase/helicase
LDCATLVAPGPTSLAKAPPALLDCIFRRGKWARGAASAIDHQIAAPADDPRRNDGYRPRDDSIRRYAVAALDNQVRKVEQAAKGSRNQTVNDVALQLGHLVAAGALSEAVVRQLLEDAACVCGLAKDDGIASVRSTISSGLKAGLGQPTDLTKLGRRAARRRASRSSRWPVAIGDHPSQGGGAEEQSVTPGDAGDDARLPLTDLGNAYRFVKRYGGGFRWCPVLGWLAWAGNCWSLDAAEGLLDNAVHEVVRSIEGEADD